jgi:hypothetical protein
MSDCVVPLDNNLAAFQRSSQQRVDSDDVGEYEYL